MATIEELKAELARREAAKGGRPDPMAALRAEAERRGIKPKPMGQRIRENIFGDNDPNTHNMGERVGAALNKAGEAMTFGLLGDEASAAVESVLPGVDYEDRRDAYRQQEEVLERDNPGTALASELAGSMAGIMLPGGAIGTLGRGAGMGSRVLASGAAGAGMGATYGAMEGEGLDDRLAGARSGAIMGGAFGIGAPVLGAAVQKGADAIVGNRAVGRAIKGAPTTDQLRSQGKSAYDAIDEAGVQIKPEALRRTYLDTLENLRANTGFDELPGSPLTPKSARTMQTIDESLEKMAQEPTAALPFKSLDQMRRRAGAAAGDFNNKADQAAGMEIISGLDDLVENLGPIDVTAGDVEALKTMIPKARDIWGRMSRSGLIDEAMDAEGKYLSGGASAIRNRFATILRNKKMSRGFSEAETDMMKKVVDGSMPSKLVNYLGSGLGMMGQVGIGSALGVGSGPMGPIVGGILGTATAAGSRKLSEAISRKGAERARALVASGGMKEIPVASESNRALSESLMRRIAASSGQ